MSWSLSTRNFPRVVDYASAHRAWARAHVVPGREHGARLFGSRRQVHSTVRIDETDESVVFSYHAFDHIRYQRNDSIVVRGYASRSSESFCNALLPAGQRVSFCGRFGFLQHRAGSWFKLDGDPFVIPRLHRKAFNAVLRSYRFADFAAWYPVAAQLGAFTVPYYTSTVLVREHLALLQDPLEWPKAGAIARPEVWRDHLLRAHPECVLIELATTLDENQLRAAEAARRRYYWHRSAP